MVRASCPSSGESRHGTRIAALTLVLLIGLGMPWSTAIAGQDEVQPARNLEQNGVTFYVEPDSNAARQAEIWRETRPDDAAAMDILASQPSAAWFGDWISDIRAGVDERVTTMTEAGNLPILVPYNIPSRDCGLYSAGGTSDADAYRVWIEGFAAGIGNRPAVVILEPDALTGADCLEAAQQTERYALLSEAVDILEANPATDVYIDAGHSAWLPADIVAERLSLVGIERATGFAINVSNFQETADLIDYGVEVSDNLGAAEGTPFLIDTSRNGNGPWESNDPEAWCNPPGRAIGEYPTRDTAHPLVDAYLWIKRPGESDGTCRGGPTAGDWYPEYALGLVLQTDLPARAG